jgi:hypothetical protein
MIDLDEVRALAAARCFDVLKFDEAAFGPPEVLAGEVLAGRFDPISVLRFLEAIEQRRKPSAASFQWRTRPIPTTASAWKTMIRRKRKRIAAKSRR